MSQKAWIAQILPEDVEMLPLQLTDGEELESSARAGGGGSTCSLLVPVVAWSLQIGGTIGPNSHTVKKGFLFIYIGGFVCRGRQVEVGCCFCSSQWRMMLGLWCILFGFWLIVFDEATYTTLVWDLLASSRGRCVLGCQSTLQLKNSLWDKGIIKAKKSEEEAVSNAMRDKCHVARCPESIVYRI